MTRDYLGKSELNTEARAALEDDIDRCPICDVPFKPEDVCADDITEGTCHAGCLEGSAVVDLQTGDEIPGGKIDTYLYSEVMAPRIFDESGKGAGFELTPEAVVAALTIPPPQTHVRVEPDYCFDPDDWEFTCDWTGRNQVHGHGDALTRSDPMRVCTLMKGPDKWVADVPVTWDEHGDPDETEIKWFDSEAEARAALTSTTGGSDNG